MKRIPFDNLCTLAAVREIRPWIGAEVSNVVRPSESGVVLVLFRASAGQGAIHLDLHPQRARVHLVTRRTPEFEKKSHMLETLRSRVRGATLTDIRQLAQDRYVRATFEGPGGEVFLYVELMGRHANLILTDARGKILTAYKTLGPAVSRRPIQIGQPYTPPETEPLQDAWPVSPFLQTWLDAGGEGTLIQRFLKDGEDHPVWVPNYGAYPVGVPILGYQEVGRDSFSVAAEQAFCEWESHEHLERKRASVLGPIQRALNAREVALADIESALLDASRAQEFQRLGELVLAYGYGQPGVCELEAMSYEGDPIKIPVDPELSVPENAEVYFARSRKGKARQSFVHEQKERLEAERDDLMILVERVAHARQLEEIEEGEAQALRRRWLIPPRLPAVSKEERPYQGHRIRELIGPKGFTALLGENATSNDYLTMRVAKPDDWWLHVRGQTSAHVIIPTQKKPDRVPREVLLWAARLAVQNSVAKHSNYVEVDYTLRRYVRKPKGSAVGTVVYEREKTLVVQSLG